MAKSKKSRASFKTIECRTWLELTEAVATAKELLGIRIDEACWYRGATSRSFTLLPSLMRSTAELSDEDHTQFEQDIFFEFQARSSQLRPLSLSDWDYLFYSRHFKAPARVLDWTEALGVALFFATDGRSTGETPALWVLNPFSLNRKSWNSDEIILPKYLGYHGKSNEYLDFGEMLGATGEWFWKSPVAVYPLQCNERVSAQRAWFTVHGENRKPLEDQCSKCVVRIDLVDDCANEVAQLLNLLGIDQYTVYPDLENLALSIRSQREAWVRRKLGR